MRYGAREQTLQPTLIWRGWTRSEAEVGVSCTVSVEQQAGGRVFEAAAVIELLLIIAVPLPVQYLLITTTRPPQPPPTLALASSLIPQR